MLLHVFLIYESHNTLTNLYKISPTSLCLTHHTPKSLVLLFQFLKVKKDLFVLRTVTHIAPII